MLHKHIVHDKTGETFRLVNKYRSIIHH